MINTKSIISAAIGSAFVITIFTVPTISVAENTQSFLLVQAHEHGEDSGDKSNGKKGKSAKNDHGGDKHGKKDKDKDYAHMVASHADVLELTDEQLGKITRLEMKETKEHEKTKQKLRKNMKEFHKASMTPDTDNAALRKLGKEHVDLFNAMVEQHINERKAVHDVLTVAQIDKLKAMKMHHDEHGDGLDNGRDHH